MIPMDGRMPDRIKDTEARYEQRGHERRRRSAALAELRSGRGDAATLARRVEDPARIATRAVGAGMAASTGDVLAGRTLTPEVAFERIIGAANLLPGRFLPGGSRRAAAVGRVVLRTPGGASAGFGTGFLVAPNVILTNNHVLPDAASAAPSQIQFAYVEDRGGQIATVPVGLQPDRLFVTDEALDFTLVATAPTTADGSPVAARGWVPLIGPSGKALVGEPVNIIQHPGGRPQQIAIHDNTVVDVVDAFLHYTTDTDRGSSGSPVFNNDWDLAALHHSGVPERDAQGNILLTTGGIWDGGSATADLISWVANEGVRISAIVEHLRQRLADGRVDGDLAMLRAVLTAVDPTESALAGPAATAGATPPVTVSGPRVDDGRAMWDLTVTVPLPDSLRSTGGQSRQPAALTDLEYYDRDADDTATAAYYAHVTPDRPLFDQLTTLLDTTHTTRLTYRDARLDHLYPVVDLHPDRQLRSVYSAAHLDPDEVIAAELAAESARAERVREVTSAERFDPSELGTLLARLEAEHQFNCEHVVPQSWFDAAEPMRSDLHHLFTCDPGCNSFRSNIPYWQFPADEEAVRGECGRSAEGLKFEPEANHGAVARATLYFLIRYPGLVGDTAKELPLDRLDILLAWHTADEPSVWERHRNAEIARIQGNRNPLVDHPEWAALIDFTQGFAAVP
jgi:endonuclease G